MNRWLFVVASMLCLRVFPAVSIVPLSEQEGMERLSRSQYKVDFGKLMAHYQNQPDRMTCGPVTGAIVMNALRYNTEKAPLVDLPNKKFLNQMPEGKDKKKYDPRLRLYTAQNFMNTAAVKIKSWSRLYAEPDAKGERDPGISLEQLRSIFADAHGTSVVKMHAGTKETALNPKEGAPAPQPLAEEEYEKIVSAMKTNLKEPNNYVVVNYSRSALGQPGSGHISPVAAYDEKSDSFLVLDVNPFGGPQAWVGAQDLVNAMNTTDSEHNRGLLLISEK